METQNKIIQLEATQQKRLVKRLALTTFTGVRYLAGALAQLPVNTAQTAQDICDAWRETAAPKQ